MGGRVRHARAHLADEDGRGQVDRHRDDGIYTVVQLKQRVRILENNEGLLQRDFKTYEAFYKLFGLTCSKTVDLTSDICYCLKRENNTFFNEAILAGKLDLGDIVLIVDEVDDLVVNEKPSILYNRKDETLTPLYKQCYSALIAGAEQAAEGMDRQIWDDCVRISARPTASRRASSTLAGSAAGRCSRRGPTARRGCRRCR